jgi:PhzF family phenazine biosynthesis protein
LGIPFYQIDAFADKAFTGNPAAVCLLQEEAEEEWMQSVAAEMNLSETAFILPRSNGFVLRWFTPTTEVDLCGHATLASAHVLWNSGCLEQGDTARFHTRSGLLTAKLRNGWVELDFPSTPVVPVEPPLELSDLIGIVPKYVGQSRFDLLIELNDVGELGELNPDYVGLSRLSVRGFVVTVQSDIPDYDFLSRFFAPATGVQEDPVTGSAHCALAPYWAEKLGKKEMIGFQASRRGGEVKVKYMGDRVKLIGQAITVMHGELA